MFSWLKNKPKPEIENTPQPFRPKKTQMQILKENSPKREQLLVESRRLQEKLDKMQDRERQIQADKKRMYRGLAASALSIWAIGKLFDNDK